MKRLQPYFPPLVAFVTTLIALGHRIIRQLILPRRGRKGNLLSSLFVLFTGLSEQVIGFAETIARIPREIQCPYALDRAWVYSRRHLRRGMLIAVWALFILSSLEWTSREQTSPASPVAQLHATVAAQPVRRIIPGRRNEVLSCVASRVMIAVVYRSMNAPPATPRWLLLCTLRV